MRRINSSVVVVSVLACALLCGVSAADPREDEPTSGTCGKNINWRYDETTQTLKFNGTGDMPHYNAPYSVPWDHLRSKITGFSISEGITSIASFAFSSCSNIQSVRIPSYVKLLDSYCFSSCKNLAEVIIEEGVESLKVGSFSSCDKLTRLDVPSSVTNWGAGIANGCVNLKTIAAADNHTVYKTVDGVLLSKDETVLVEFPCGKESNYTIPSYVHEIGNWSFADCSNLLSIKLHDSVTAIKEFAFNHCLNLSSIVIPQSVHTIEFRAFSQSYNLQSVIYEGAYDPNPSGDVFYDSPVRTACVHFEYNSSTFCDITATKNNASCGIIGMENHCFKAVYDGNTWSLEKREEVSEQENMTTDCVLIYCDNETGLQAQSNCNDTSVCVDDKCVEAEKEDNELTVYIEIDDLDYVTFNLSDLLNRLCEETGLQPSDLVLGLEFNDNGQIKLVTVYTKNEVVRDAVLTAMNNIKKSTVCDEQNSDIACRTKKVFIQLKALSLSGGTMIQGISLLTLMMMVVLFCI